MSNPLLLARIEHGGHDVVVHFAGEVDMSTASIMDKAITDALGAPPPERLIVNLTDVPFLDSSGLRVLVETLRRVQESGIGLRVVAPPESPPRRVIELVELGDALGLADTVADVGT